MKKIITKQILCLTFIVSVNKMISQEINSKIEVFQPIPCLYDEVYDFNDGLASVKLNGNWSFIDKNGKEIIKYIQDEYHKDYPYVDFNNGLSIRRFGHYNDESVYFINKKGEKVSSIFQYASNYNEGFACVKIDNWKGLIDINGKKVLTCNCEDTKFRNELLKIENQDKMGNENTVFIDKKGNSILTLPKVTFCNMCYLATENRIILNTGECSRIIDFKGKDLIPINSFIAVDFNNEMVLLKANKMGASNNNYYNYFNIETNKIIEFKYKDAKIFSEDLAAVKIQEKWGFIDKNGKIVIQPIYDKAYYFNEGFSIIKINGKYGFIDKSGKFLISPKFEDVKLEGGLARNWGTIDGFNDGLINVKFNGKWGVINTFGNNVTKFKYDYISKFSEGIAVVKIDKKYGYIDKSGNELTAFIYDEANNFNEGLSRIKINGKYGYLSIKTNE